MQLPVQDGLLSGVSALALTRMYSRNCWGRKRKGCSLWMGRVQQQLWLATDSYRARFLAKVQHRQRSACRALLISRYYAHMTEADDIGSILRRVYMLNVFRQIKRLVPVKRRLDYAPDTAIPPVTSAIIHTICTLHMSYVCTCTYVDKDHLIYGVTPIVQPDQLLSLA